MAKIATKLEDIGDERDQAVFMAMVKLWYDGDIQAALADREKILNERDELEKQPGVLTSPFDNTSNIHLRFST